MIFRLFYRGPLHANGSPEEKSAIRKKFHCQLAALWEQPPLLHIKKYIDPNYRPDTCYLGIDRHGTVYYPIISEKIVTIAALDILMLRPGDPGSILVGGGDIDNRLKTLFDSLQPPQAKLPESMASMFCLLQDDKLVARVSVETDRLLDGQQKSSNEVILVIKVDVLASAGIGANSGITS